MLEYASWDSISTFFSCFVWGNICGAASFCRAKASSFGDYLGSFWGKKEFVAEYSLFSFSLISLVFLVALAFGIALLITYQNDKKTFNKLTSGIMVMSFLLHTKSSAVWNRWDAGMKEMSGLFSAKNLTSEHTVVVVFSVLFILFLIAGLVFHEFSVSNFAAGFLFLNLDAIISFNLYSSSLLFSNFLPSLFGPGSILGTMIGLNFVFFVFYFLSACFKTLYKRVIEVAALSMGLEKAKNEINIIFKHLQKLFTVKAREGQTLLQVAHENNIPLEGACEGNLACSTCHVVCDKSIFRENEISDKENDLLDLAYGLRPTSRLGCQVKVRDFMDNKIFEIPKATRNMAVDGYKPSHH